MVTKMEFTVVRSIGDDAEIYIVNDKPVMVCWGFSTGSDTGLHNCYDTEVIVATWEGDECSIDDLPYLTDENWNPYEGFDVDPDFENGCDWADFERTKNKVLKSLHEQTP